MKFIALLRGINVSGQKPVKMDALRHLFESMGFGNVATYIQSGNVVFDSIESNAHALETQIETAIAGEFGFQVPVMVRTHEQWRALVTDTPYNANAAKEEGTRYLVTLLDDTVDAGQIGILQSYATQGETVKAGERAIYLHCPNGYGKTKLSNAFIENKLNIRATTRNWKTMLTLLEMSSG